jgi:hypothetical protein
MRLRFVLIVWSLLTPGVGQAFPQEGEEPPDLDRMAFFILQPDMIRAQNWPEAYSAYDLLVCNPSMDSEDLSIIRQDLPDALLLAYASAQDAPLDVYPGNPYYEAMAEMFPDEYCLHDLNTGEIIRISIYGDPCFIMHRVTADALVQFHQTVTMSVPWNGIYVDLCTKVFPDRRKGILNSITDRFDINNDHFADNMALLDLQYGTWRPYFTSKLRQAFPDKLIIANSGGRIDDSALNGISLEGVGDRFTEAEARLYLTAQLRLGVAPFTCILWRTTAASEQPSRRLAAEIAGVYYGTVYVPEGQQLIHPEIALESLCPYGMRYEDDGAPR